MSLNGIRDARQHHCLHRVPVDCGGGLGHGVGKQPRQGCQIDSRHRFVKRDRNVRGVDMPQVQASVTCSLKDLGSQRTRFEPQRIEVRVIENLDANRRQHLTQRRCVLMHAKCDRGNASRAVPQRVHA